MTICSGYFLNLLKCGLKKLDYQPKNKFETLREMIKRGQCLGCISNTQDAFFMSKSLAFSDRTFKTPTCVKAFDSVANTLMLRMLMGENLLRVLKYEYAVSFTNSKSNSTVLFADDSLRLRDDRQRCHKKSRKACCA